jgi:hypothetical protein
MLIRESGCLGFVFLSEINIIEVRAPLFSLCSAPGIMLSRSQRAGARYALFPSFLHPLHFAPSGGLGQSAQAFSQDENV